MSVAAAANAIVTWAEYKALFGIFSDSEQDLYQTLINQASSRIDLYTGRTLKTTAYSGATALILDGHGRAAIVCPHRPIVSVAHLYSDSARAFAAASEVASTDYRIDAKAGIISLYSGEFPDELGAVKLECTAGYASTSPEWQVLQSACMELVTWMKSRVSGFIGKRSETNADGMNIGYEIDIPANVRAMLDQFREVAV